MTAWDYYAFPIELGELKNLSTEEYKQCIREGSVFIDDLDVNRKDYEELCLEFLSYRPWDIKGIKSPTYEMWLQACRFNGNTIRFAPKKERTQELKLVAVTTTGDALQYLKKPSEEVKLAAVSQDGYAIQYIKNPSEAVQLAAVNQRASSLKFVKKPTEKVKVLAASTWYDALDYITDISYEVAVAAVNNYGRLIGKIPKELHTKELKLMAVKDDGRAIYEIENPTDEMLRVHYESFIKPQIKK